MAERTLGRGGKDAVGAGAVAADDATDEAGVGLEQAAHELDVQGAQAGVVYG